MQGCGADQDASSLSESPRAKIIGGQDDDEGQYPAVVLVKQGPASCSGTFVSPSVILTAAHCAEPQDAQ